MFFSRCRRSERGRGKRLKDEHLAGSQVVLYKVSRCRADQPGLGGAALQIYSQVVLYKQLHALLRIPSPLKLAIPLDSGFMRLPVSSLITGMGLAPFAPAVANDLGVFRVRRDLPAMVLGAAAALTLRLAADALVQTEL
jgi:hypothetical protein